MKIVPVDPEIRSRESFAGLRRAWPERVFRDGVSSAYWGRLPRRGRALVAPVRPTLRHRYPLTPIERYAEWRLGDGLLFDP